MQKKVDLEGFFKNKIKQVDVQFAKEEDEMGKLRLATMRASYSKLMSNFLKDERQLSRSYFQMAKIYLKCGKIDQAISQCEIGKRKILNYAKQSDSKALLQDINLLLVQCNLENKKVEDAQSIIDEITISTDQNKQKYLSLKGKIYQTLDNEIQSKQIYQELHQLVLDKYGQNSLEDGLCLIKMGKNQGSFSNYQKAINLLNEGIQILISKRYQNPQHVATIYQTLADFSRRIEDYEKEYSSLICAFSMIKQLQQNQEIRTIQVLSKLSTNLLKRDEQQKALQYLTQVEQIQRRIHGESSVNLAKTVKKIIAILTQLNRSTEVKRYENEYEYLLGNNKTSLSKVNYNIPNQKTNTSNSIAPSSIQRQKAKFSNNKEQEGISRVIN